MAFPFNDSTATDLRLENKCPDMGGEEDSLLVVDGDGGGGSDDCGGIKELASADTLDEGWTDWDEPWTGLVRLAAGVVAVVSPMDCVGGTADSLVEEGERGVLHTM